MKRTEKLNFPTFKFKVKRDHSSSKEDALLIWDELRHTYLKLTPEEWVRQHLIRFLIEHLGVEPQRIAQEHQVMIQGMPQRADVVVYSNTGVPVLVCECKAPSIAVDKEVYAQALRYNNVLGAKYILLTNGMEHRLYEKNDRGEYVALKEFPKF